MRTPGQSRLTRQSPARRPNDRAILSVLVAAYFVYSLMQSLVVPALTTIQHEFDATPTSTAWLFTVFLLASSVSTPILGRLGDLFGREKMLLLSIAFLAVGCALGAVAPSIGVLIVARAFQGLAGPLMPVGFGIVRDQLPPARLTSAIAVLSSMLSVGSAVGIVLAGPVVDHFGFRWLFWLPLFAVVPLLVAVRLVVPPSPRAPVAKVDVTGAVLLAAWLICLLLGVSQSPAWGWTAPGTLALFGGGIVLALVWVQFELRVADPLVDMTSMRRPAVWRANAITFLYGVSMFAAFAFLPQFVQVPTTTGYGLGLNASAAGLTMLPWCITSAAVGMATGRLIRRFGNQANIVIACAITSLACVQFALWSSSVLSVHIASAVMGVGIGIVAAAVPNVIVEEVAASEVGVMTGMNSNIRSISGTIGSQVFAAILAASVAGGIWPSEAAYRNAFLLLAVTSALGALVALTLRSHPRFR